MCAWAVQGDQYDVREKTDSREVRNLGKPVELAARYFDEGADEVTFLNITGFRDCPLQDLPMLEVLKQVGGAEGGVWGCGGQGVGRWGVGVLGCVGLALKGCGGLRASVRQVMRCAPTYKCMHRCCFVCRRQVSVSLCL